MTTTWRYVVSRERGRSNQGRHEDVYAIRELYTSDDGKLSWSAEPVSPVGETWLELADDVSKMSRAIGGAILDLTLDPPALVLGDRARRKGR